MELKITENDIKINATINRKEYTTNILLLTKTIWYTKQFVGI